MTDVHQNMEKPQIYVSSDLVEIIKERQAWGRTKEVIKLTLFNSFSTYTGAPIHTLLEGLVKQDCLSSDITVTPDYNHVFKGSEEEVIKRIKAIPRIAKKTPEKMQVKMIAQRLIKIFKGLQFLEEYMIARRHTHGKPPPPLSRGTITSSHMSLYYDPSVYIYSSDKVFRSMKKAARELTKILNRENVTEGIIDQAWDQFLVEKTMIE
jgi:hypothetical protein